MRVLLDEQLPRRLARHLEGHDATTVQQQGWAGLKNGVLLQTAAARGIDAFVTADQNLQYQQNLTNVRLIIIVLVAPTNTLDDLVPLVPEVLIALERAQAGEVIRVGSR